jgi:glutamate racemase
MAVTRFYMVVPTTEEIIAASGNITVQVLTTRSAADAAAVKSAITTGSQRIIVEAIAYAESTLDPATITAQIETITP